MLAAALAVATVVLPAAARADVSAGEIPAARQAIKAAEDGKEDEARRIARKVGDPLLTKIVTWIDLGRPDPHADYDTLAEFLRDNQDWPGKDAIRRNLEGAMPSLPPAEVVRWYDANPPLTLGGFYRYIDALLALNLSDRAITLVRQRYIDGDFSAGDEREYRQKFNALLRPEDNEVRLDRLLWDEEADNARRLMPLVVPAHQALAEARLALQSQAPGVERLVARVPASLANDPGLQYERARWRRRKDMDEEALAILESPPRDLVRPTAWWTERHIMARRLMEKRDFARAYKLVERHGIPDGADFAQAEFLAGFIALRFLNQPEQGLKHFEALYRNVKTPVSLTRGAYWAGRAAKAAGDPERARTWFDAAAVFGTTFYGQVAGAELGMPPNAGIPREPPLAAATVAAFNKKEPVRAVRLLRRIEGDQGRYGDLFLRRLAGDAKDVEQYHLIGKLAAETNRRDLGIQLAKEAMQDGVPLLSLGYPMLDTKLAAQPERALVHALIRQESVFNKDAVSPAGARGLMQLMPATAQHVAKRIGLKTKPKQITDPAVNIRLGTAYVQDMLDRFDGSYVLTIAAYNGGPGRVSSWLKDYGDPRTEAVDPIDWIELIPVYETRNYVQRVLENLQVYRLRFSDPAVSITQDLKR